MPDNDFRKKYIAWLEKLKVFAEYGDGLYYFGNNGFTYVGNLTLKPQGKSALETINEEKVDNQNCVKPVDKVEPKFKVGDSISKKHNSDINKFGIFTITSIADNKYWYNDSVVCDFSDQDLWELVERTKFKKGDWVFHNTAEFIYMIQTIGRDGYGVISRDGKKSVVYYSAEINYRLWTIQDVKDGDVLSDGTTIFIFKDLLSDGSVMSYCDYDIDSDESGAFCPLSVNLMCSKITPATKAQRAILFGGLADAGYTFDFEKKELKKIEQKPVIEMKTPEESLGIDSDTYNKIVDECVYGDDDQKPAWNEEDDKMLNDIIMCGEHHCYLDVGNIDWLKSLKCRVQPQPKQEWSEEEKARIDKIVDVLDWAEEKGYIRYSDWEDYICYVKSLRPQNTWKPSKEQIVALRWVLNNVSYNKHKEEISELLEQLKRLIDEDV